MYVWKGFKYQPNTKLALKKFTVSWGQKDIQIKYVCGKPEGSNSAGPWGWKGQGQAELRGQGKEEGREDRERNGRAGGKGSMGRFGEHLIQTELRK